jgi:hypothetical protein
MTLRTTALVFATTVAICGTAAARSPSSKPGDDDVAKAETRFARGVELYQGGRLDAALAEFNKAYTLAVVAVVATRDAPPAPRETKKPTPAGACSQPEARKDPDPVIEPGMDLDYRPNKPATLVTSPTSIDEKDPYAS